MTKEQIFEYFATNSANLGISTVLITMLSGLAVAVIIYMTYYLTYRGVAYNSRFNASLVVILLIAVVIMLMISSNIVISLGMVGALSIVRFRTAVKDSGDTVFIFWAIAEGLCVGSRNNRLAFVTTLAIAIVIVAFSLFAKKGNGYLIVIRGGSTDVMDVYLVELAVKRNTKHARVRSVNLADDHQEMIIEASTKSGVGKKLQDDLLQMPGVDSVNWIAKAGENLG